MIPRTCWVGTSAPNKEVMENKAEMADAMRKRGIVFMGKKGHDTPPPTSINHISPKSRLDLENLPC